MFISTASSTTMIYTQPDDSRRLSRLALTPLSTLRSETLDDNLDTGAFRTWQQSFVLATLQVAASSSQSELIIRTMSALWTELVIFVNEAWVVNLKLYFDSADAGVVDWLLGGCTGTGQA
jgi:hypothetical protein